MTQGGDTQEGTHGGREDLLDHVSEDPRLTPEEKETTIQLSKDGDRARVFSAEAGVCRRLLSHPEADDVALIVAREGRARPAIDPCEHDGEPIVGVSLTLPVGALSVKSGSRKSTSHAAIVSKQVLREGGTEA